MFSAISSTSPRVFINAPSANESIQFTPVSRAVSIAPPSLPTVAIRTSPPQINNPIVAIKAQPAANQPPVRVVQQTKLRAQSDESEKQRQQKYRAEMFQPQPE